MTQDTEPKNPCEEFELLMMRHFDREIAPADEDRLQSHLHACSACTRAFGQYRRLLAATEAVTLRPLPREQWDLYWARIYNRVERKTAWIVVSIGVIGAVLYGLLRLALLLARDQTISVWVKLSIAALVLGFTLLFLSVLREKMALRRNDKYQGVIR